MQINIKKSDLVRGLGLVAALVRNSSGMPILSNVLLKADGDVLRMTVNNLSMVVSVGVAAEVCTPGATTLNAKRLLSIVREMPESVISFTMGSGGVKIASGRSVFRLNSIDAGQFPATTAVAGTTICWEIAQDVFVRSVGRVVYAASKDQSRATLNGVLFNANGDTLTLVATDGRRLSLARSAAQISSGGRFILPSDTIPHIVSASGPGKMAVVCDGKLAKFTLAEVEGFSGNIEITSKLVDGSFPDYSKVIPSGATPQLVIDRSVFGESLKRIALATDEKSVAVIMGIEPGRISLSAKSSSFGEANETYEAEYTGPAMRVAFNPGYVRDILNGLDGDKVVFEIVQDTAPIVVKQGDEFIAVVMPIRAD